MSSNVSRDAQRALWLLLAVNLFNYLDRYILAAVELEIRYTFFAPDDLNAKAATGSLALWFLGSYMIAAPLCGWLANKISRWWLIGAAVGVWSLASGASGLATTFVFLLVARIFVGIGEGGYGPIAPTLISDYFPVEVRGRKMSLFYMAIPVGSALGYAFGGFMSSSFGWRVPFYAVVLPGIFLAWLCTRERDPRGAPGQMAANPGFAAYPALLRIRSYVMNTTAMTAMTFAVGGISFWIPSYLKESRGIAEPNTMFGGITVVAGFLATFAGGWLGDRLRGRVRGSYFLVSGCAMLLAVPFVVAMLYVPFPAAWGFIFFAVFFLFFNTGPSNTALANVTSPAQRTAAFALNILCIHLLGDAVSPLVLGYIAGHANYNAAFLLVAAMMTVGAIIWIISARWLDEDTACAERIGSAPGEVQVGR